MKRNQNRVHKNGSRSAAVSQPKTGKVKAGHRPTSVLPNIALFLEDDGGASEEAIHLSKAEYAELKRAAVPTRDGVLMFMARAGLEKARWPAGPGHQPTANSGSPSGLCLFDRGVREVVSEIPLVGEQLPSVVVAACRQRTTVDQFIADAIREKLSKPVDKSTSSSPAPEEHGFITDGIVVKLADHQENELGTINIDDRESGLLQKAAAASGLRLIDMVSFIIFRQLEAFYPPGVKGIWRVSDDALNEISNGLAGAELKSDAFWAVSRALIERVSKVSDLASPADYGMAICDLKGLSTTIEALSSLVRVKVADAREHWRTSACPALLEQHVAPVSRPLARAAA
jgi:hypothetical protein